MEIKTFLDVRNYLFKHYKEKIKSGYKYQTDISRAIVTDINHETQDNKYKLAGLIIAYWYGLLSRHNDETSEKVRKVIADKNPSDYIEESLNVGITLSCAIQEIIEYDLMIDIKSNNKNIDSYRHYEILKDVNWNDGIEKYHPDINSELQQVNDCYSCMSVFNTIKNIKINSLPEFIEIYFGYITSIKDESYRVKFINELLSKTTSDEVKDKIKEYITYTYYYKEVCDEKKEINYRKYAYYTVFDSIRNGKEIDNVIIRKFASYEDLSSLIKAEVEITEEERNLFEKIFRK